ncbi:hypothetical protein [Parafrankia sp. FMc2]|uniref:hypothetical protein n=1 Tax=Parafrankia sp. FMc2 TaxID=3233196 RepID=UPI0034D549EF
MTTTTDTAPDTGHLVATLPRGLTADPDVLADVEDWRSIPPRRAGARRRGLAGYRRRRGFTPAATKGPR